MNLTQITQHHTYLRPAGRQCKYTLLGSPTVSGTRMEWDIDVVNQWLMVACSLLEAPGETLSKAPVGGSCREEDTNFSNPYNNLFRPYIIYNFSIFRTMFLCNGWVENVADILPMGINMIFRRSNLPSCCLAWVKEIGEAGKQHHESQKIEPCSQECIHRAQCGRQNTDFVTMATHCPTARYGDFRRTLVTVADRIPLDWCANPPGQTNFHTDLKTHRG